MKIYDNSTTMRREYYAIHGELRAFMHHSVIDFLQGKERPKTIQKGYRLDEWGAFPDHPDNEPEK